MRHVIIDDAGPWRGGGTKNPIIRRRVITPIANKVRDTVAAITGNTRSTPQADMKTVDYAAISSGRIAAGTVPISVLGQNSNDPWWKKLADDAWSVISTIGSAFSELFGFFADLFDVANFEMSTSNSNDSIVENIQIYAQNVINSSQDGFTPVPFVGETLNIDERFGSEAGYIERCKATRKNLAYYYFLYMDIDFNEKTTWDDFTIEEQLDIINAITAVGDTSTAVWITGTELLKLTIEGGKLVWGQAIG